MEKRNSPRSSCTPVQDATARSGSQYTLAVLRNDTRATSTGFSLSHYLWVLSGELRDLHERGLLPTEAVTDGNWNQNSWLHSRLFGALVRAVERPLVPLVEVGWSKGFCPDLCIIDQTDSVQAVIEYESTNSSDERLVGKDIAHYEEAILAQAADLTALPSCWVLISTLPSCDVKRWPWWEWNTLTGYPPAVKDRNLRNACPLSYYEGGLHASLAATWGRIVSAFGGEAPLTLAWVNLDQTLTLTTKNVNGTAVT